MNLVEYAGLEFLLTNFKPAATDTKNVSFFAQREELIIAQKPQQKSQAQTLKAQIRVRTRVELAIEIDLLIQQCKSIHEDKWPVKPIRPIK